ncbi:hypothetical protein GQ457_11G001990 [Hibiscus cannabinus]
MEYPFVVVGIELFWSLLGPMRTQVGGSLGVKIMGMKKWDAIFFAWYDAPVDPRARVIMVGLLKKQRKMERARFLERMGWSCVLVVCLMILWILK